MKYLEKIKNEKLEEIRYLKSRLESLGFSEHSIQRNCPLAESILHPELYSFLVDEATKCLDKKIYGVEAERRIELDLQNYLSN
jgi:hypothetical protein